MAFYLYHFHSSLPSNSSCVFHFSHYNLLFNISTPTHPFPLTPPPFTQNKTLIYPFINTHMYMCLGLPLGIG